MILLGFVLCALSAGAYDFPDHEHGLYLNYLSDGSVEVTYYDDNYNTYSGYVEIPTEAVRGALASTQTYFPITRIGKYAFRRCLSLTGVSIPTSVTSIGESAFWNCSLTSVAIPYSVKTIEYNAFGDCDNLTNVIIGTGLTYIGTYGFDSPLTYICIYASTPPTINNENAFRASTYNNADLLIPDGSYNAYKNATYWSNFVKMRTVSAVPINSTNFPDANFRSALLALYPSGYISDIATVTELDVHGKSISDLTGIELFTGLKKLVCYNNPLTSLNVSSNTQLVYLDCAPVSSYTGTKLSSLNVSGCTNLEELYCYNNNLTWINVDNCTKLKYFSGYNNRFTNLYFLNKSQLYYLNCSNNPQLQTLACYRCVLTTLNVSGCTALYQLMCYENADLTSITGLADCTAMTYLDCEDCKIADLSAVDLMSNLEKLYCRNNKLTSLDVSYKPNLTIVRAHTNPLMTTAKITDNDNLTSLDIHGCPALTELECYWDPKLTTLNVSGNTSLTYLYCYYNEKLATITGLATCTALTYLDCEDDAIQSLGDLNSLPNITELYCRNNKLVDLYITNRSKLTIVRAHGNPLMTECVITGNPLLTNVDIHDCTALPNLECHDNSQLGSLNVSGNTALEKINCYRNKLTSLDVTSLTNLIYLFCNDNQLSSLNVANNNKLITLDCRSNQLTSLNLSGKTTLKFLYCENNLLTSLNVQGCISIEHMKCSHNKLTSLNVASLSNLGHLYCDNNLLTTLNMSSNTNTIYIDCNTNKLTSLNVQGCSKLTQLFCQNNQLTSLYLQGCSKLKTLDCYKNKITESGMTTLINSLTARASNDWGLLRVQYNTGESNVFTSAHVTAARAKYWALFRWNGTNWVEIPAVTAGDVNGDGVLNLTDVTTLLTLILNEGPSASSYPAGDYNGDGVINLTDVTMLLTYILNS